MTWTHGIMTKKSVVIVGNGPNILNSNLGNKINQFDYVMRFNSPNIIDYKKDVGEKTTHWVVAKSDVFLAKYYKDYLPQFKDLKEIWYVYNKPHTLNKLGFDKESIDRYDNTTKRLLNGSALHQKFVPQKLKTREDFKCLKAISHGWYGIIHMLDLCSKIYICGFTYENPAKDIVKNNYYSDHMCYPIHDIGSEYKFFKPWFDNGSLEFLEENTNIRKSEYKEVNVKGTCSKCKKPYMEYDWEPPTSMCDTCRYGFKNIWVDL